MTGTVQQSCSGSQEDSQEKAASGSASPVRFAEGCPLPDPVGEAGRMYYATFQESSEIPSQHQALSPESSLESSAMAQAPRLMWVPLDSSK